MIRAQGAPFEQGRTQGRALRPLVREGLRALRRACGAASWWALRAEARRGPGRRLSRFLPQQHERLEGIARGAGVPLASLLVAEGALRAGAAGAATREGLRASLDLPGAVRGWLDVRETRPDAGGFASVEVTGAAWTGCLGGVNEAGLAVVCLDDRELSAPPLRILAQDVLFRASTLGAALEHLRRRARYAGGTGSLLLSDAARAVRVEVRHGVVSTREEPRQSGLAARPALELLPEKRALAWRDPGGRLHTAAL